MPRRKGFRRRPCVTLAGLPLDHPCGGDYTPFRNSAFRQRTPNSLKPMTKRDLVVRISGETGLVQQQVLEVVQKTLDYISQSLTRGEKVELRNFGVFEVKIRKARVGRNPNAPETDVPIPQRAVVKFKAGKEMREAVIQLTPEQVAQANLNAPSSDSSDEA